MGRAWSKLKFLAVAGVGLFDATNPTTIPSTTPDAQINRKPPARLEFKAILRQRFATPDICSNASISACVPFLPKPWAPSQVLSHVTQAVQRH